MDNFELVRENAKQWKKYMDEFKSTKRIEELEEKLLGWQNSTTSCFNYQKTRIDDLEKKLEDITHRVFSAEQKGCIAMDAIEGNGKFKNKIPHKCPICDGNGQDRSMLIMTFPSKFPPCNACEGKGIVWG